jgi:hypothetical protein
MAVREEKLQQEKAYSKSRKIEKRKNNYSYVLINLVIKKIKVIKNKIRIRKVCWRK